MNFFFNKKLGDINKYMKINVRTHNEPCVCIFKLIIYKDYIIIIKNNDSYIRILSIRTLSIISVQYVMLII